MARSWTIGSGPDCDLVVDRPVVSGRHCRLTRVGDGYLLEDLGSTNGTFVNGYRVSAGVRVARGDAVTLGLNQPMPWPDESGDAGPGEAPPRGVVRVGREADNDMVVNLPTVSAYHARIVGDGGGGAVIEDLGSSNGTYVNGRRVDRNGRLPVRPGDSISLGSYSFVYSGDARPQPVTRPTELVALPTAPPGPWSEPVLVPPASPPVDADGPTHSLLGPFRRPTFLLAQGPAAAFLIVAGLRSAAEPADPGEVAAVLFRLAFAAVWFGLSSALLLEPLDRRRLPAGGASSLTRTRLALLAGVCVVQCVTAWAVVAAGAGLRASWSEGFAVVALAAAVGAALGLVLGAAAPRPSIAWAGVPLVLLLLWTLGGERPALPRMPSAARAVAGAVPSRWAFEGLLLLETAGRPTPEGPPAVEEPTPSTDFAEAYFPAESERMGVTAAVTAMAFMLGGLAAAAWFISVWRPGPSPG